MKKLHTSKKVGIKTLAVLVFAILLMFSLVGCWDDNDDTPMNNEKLQISEVKMVTEYNEYLGYSVKITGVAKNVSGKKLSYASVEFVIYAADGSNLGTALDNINNLYNGDTWRFEAALFSFPKIQPTSYRLSDITAW